MAFPVSLKTVTQNQKDTGNSIFRILTANDKDTGNSMFGILNSGDSISGIFTSMEL